MIFSRLSPLATDLSMYFKNIWKKYSKIRLFCVIATFITILALVLSTVMAIVYMPQGTYYEVELDEISTTNLKIEMIMQYIEIDATAGTMTADWYPWFDCKDLPVEEVVNIYFDPNLFGGSPSEANNLMGPSPSDQPPSRPTFQFNTTNDCQSEFPPHSSFATFRTVSKLIRRQTDRSRVSPSLQWYPMDTYIAVFRLFAQLNSTTASVGIHDPVLFGNPVNFNVVLDQPASSNTKEGLFFILIVKRAITVKALVVFIVMANWVASIAFLWITIASFLWPEAVVKEMFVVPIAALFAFTSVRSNMPGAPAGFGAFIDFVGILPNIALMAICSATLLLVVLIRRTYSQERDPEQHKKHDAGQGQEQDIEQHQERDIEQRREQDAEQHLERDTEQHREQDSEHLERGTEQRREQDAEQHLERDSTEQCREQDAEQHLERDIEQHREQNLEQGQDTDSEQNTIRAGESQNAMQPVSNETPNTKGTTGINIVKAEPAHQDKPEMLILELSRIDDLSMSLHGCP